MSETATFTAGSSHVRCFTVNVLADKLVERVETFSLVLTSNTDGVELASSKAHFTITDTDGKPCKVQVLYIHIPFHVVVCLASSLDTSRGFFSWPETFPGETAIIPCENGTTPRSCSSTGQWEEPNTSDCYVSTNELFRYIEKVCSGSFPLGNKLPLVYINSSCDS